MTDSEGCTAQLGLCTFSQPGLPQLLREIFEADANVPPWTQQLPRQGPDRGLTASVLSGREFLTSPLVFFTVAPVKHEP